MYKLLLGQRQTCFYSVSHVGLSGLCRPTLYVVADCHTGWLFSLLVSELYMEKILSGISWFVWFSFPFKEVYNCEIKTECIIKALLRCTIQFPLTLYVTTFQVQNFTLYFKFYLKN